MQSCSREEHGSFNLCVVTEETNSDGFKNASGFILASYVKFLESGGARVVPVMIHKSREYYKKLLSRINGVMFPGGDDILQTSGYGRAGKIIFDIAVQMNEKGDYFPLWGTCLGFELLNYMAVKKLWMKACNADDFPTNINFVTGFKRSRIFGNLDDSLERIMQNEKIAYHYHEWCLTPENYTISGLDKYFKVLAVNKDSRNITFVSIVEAYKYPFYGVMFHPEKTVFEWALKRSIPHTMNAIRVSQYFANFFVNEARKNSHCFASRQEEDTVLIYNYNPVYTGKLCNDTCESVQSYYFT